MPRRTFKEEQIIAILREAERGEKPIGDLCRSHSIAENTFYRWRQKYGGLHIPEVKRLRDLEQENARLKRLLAERCLEIDAIKDVLAKNC